MARSLGSASLTASIPGTALCHAVDGRVWLRPRRPLGKHPAKAREFRFAREDDELM